MTLIGLDRIEEVVTLALVSHGANQTVAASVARAVRVAEANENRICGLYYVASYCQQLVTGRVDGNAQPVVSVPRPGVVRVDAGHGFAQPAFDMGQAAAIRSAETNGICGFAIEHSHTATSLGYFTERFAEAGFLAIGATNASPRVAPPGGKFPLLGTNPIAMAVPDGRGRAAFQFDFSTSAVALGRITMAAAAGASIPLGWALDSDGEPTTDPAAALEGSLLSAGGYKGYGIGLMVEILASALCGTRRSVDVPPLKAADGPPHDLGQFYLVIDPRAYSDEAFYAHLESLARSVSADTSARLPGAARPNSSTVEVADDLWDVITSLAK